METHYCSRIGRGNKASCWAGIRVLINCIALIRAYRLRAIVPHLINVTLYQWITFFSQPNTLFIIIRVCVCVCMHSVTRSSPTLCIPMNCSPPGSSVHGILQVRILERVAIFYCRRSFQPRDQTRASYIGMRILHHWTTWEAPPVIPLCVPYLKSVSIKDKEYANWKAIQWYIHLPAKWEETIL